MVEEPLSSRSGMKIKFPDGFPDSEISRTVRTDIAITPAGVPTKVFKYNGIIPRLGLDTNLGAKEFKLRSFYARAYQECFFKGTRQRFDAEISNLQRILKRVGHGEQIRRNEYHESLSRVEVLTMLEMQLASDSLEQHLKAIYFLENYEKGQWREGCKERMKEMRHDYFQIYESLSEETKNDLQNAWKDSGIGRGEPKRPIGQVVEKGALGVRVFITFPNNKEAVYGVNFDERTGFVDLRFDPAFVRHKTDDIGPGECTIPLHCIPPHYSIADEGFSECQVQESLRNAKKRMKRYLPFSNFENVLRFLSEKEGVPLWNIRYASENVTLCEPRVLFFDLSVMNDFFNHVRSVLKKKALKKDRAERK